MTPKDESPPTRAKTVQFTAMSAMITALPSTMPERRRKMISAAVAGSRIVSVAQNSRTPRGKAL